MHENIPATLLAGGNIYEGFGLEKLHVLHGGEYLQMSDRISIPFDINVE